MAEKREGDYTIFVIMLVVALFSLTFVFLESYSPTGNVVATGGGFDGDAEQLKKDVDAYVKTFPGMGFVGHDAEMCLIINTGEEIYSFDLYKRNGAVEVTQVNSRYCDNDFNNQGSEDIVMKYVDYASFISHKENPSCDVLKKSGQGDDFYYLPSEFVQQGGVPVCNELFKERYCPAVRSCATIKEMKKNGLACCLTAKEKNTGIPMLFQNKYLLFFVFLFLFGFTTILVVFLLEEQKTKKNNIELEKCLSQLHNYVAYCKSLGHKADQVRDRLLKQGWASDIVEFVMKGKK